MPAKDLVFTVLGIDRASKVFDRVGDSMDKMGNRAAIALAGITGGSAVAAGAVAASVGALPLAFAGLGAIALRENAQIRGSFIELSETVRTGLMADAAPLESAYVGAAQKMGAAYVALRPQLQQAFAASVPVIEHLTDGVIKFARNAMPGMVTAVQASGPVMAAFEDVLAEAGAGVSEFFSVMATGSGDAALGVQHLGGLVRGLLPEIGGILVDLTGLWATHGDEVSDVVVRMVGVIGDLSGHALPVVSSALGVALDILSGVLNVVEPLSGALGPLIGVWLSLATAMRAMSAVRGVIDNVATGVSRFSEDTKKASASGGTFAGVSRGLMGLLGGPWGLALAGASIALAIFGQKSQQSADDQRSLASALRESRGAFDESARSALADTEGYKAVASSVERAGITHGQYMDALIQGGPTLDGLRARLEQQAEAGKRVTEGTHTVHRGYTAQGQAALDLLNATAGLRGTIEGASESARIHGEAVLGASGAMYQAKPGADALRESMTTLANATATTKDHVDALNEAWRILYGFELTIEEANARFEEGMDNLRESVASTRQETANWQGALFLADGQINVSTEQGRKLSAQLMTTGEDYRGLARTAYDSALRQGQSQEQATAVAARSVAERRAQFISEMIQMGFNANQAQQLADKYFGLPTHILTTITGNVQPAMAAVIGWENWFRPRSHQTIVIETQIQGQIGGFFNREGYRRGAGGTFTRAHGGPVPSQSPVLVGEHGPEMLVPSGPARVLNARDTRKMLHSGQTTIKNYNLAVYSTNSDTDIRTQFRRLELMEGL